MNQLYDRYQLPLMIVHNELGAMHKLNDNEIDDSYRI